jgi:hypothetical protein
MPGKTTYCFRGPSDDGTISVYSLEVIRPKVSDNTVFFTDESPEFKIKVENLTDRSIQGPLTIFIGYGTGTFEHTDRERIQVDLDAGETEVFAFGGYLLSYQGNGIIAHHPPTNFRGDDEEVEIYSKEADKYEPLYSFTIWDRHFYKINYTWPRRAQFASAILAVLIILVGIVQILLNQGIF